MLATTDAFKMTEAPSDSSGSDLLHRAKEAFYIDVEDRVIELLSYRAEGGILRDTGIREHNIK